MKINDLLMPGVKAPKSPVERHHLFPKAYLSSIGITGSTKANQIANFAFLEWADNIEVSDTNPSEYFPKHFGELSANEQVKAEFWHALPANWHEMEYVEFLKKRCLKIAMVVKKGFEKLSSGADSVLDKPHLPTIEELLKQMETFHVEFKATARVAQNPEIPEKVINEGVIKSIAAFMNSDGGTLAIGISDDGDVLGIEKNLKYKNQDIDSYQNWLSTLFINTLGAAVTANYVSIRFETEDDKVVCLVDV